MVHRDVRFVNLHPEPIVVHASGGAARVTDKASVLLNLLLPELTYATPFAGDGEETIPNYAGIAKIYGADRVRAMAFGPTVIDNIRGIPSPGKRVSYGGIDGRMDGGVDRGTKGATSGREETA